MDSQHLSDEPALEGPPIPITIDMTKKAISKMKFGTAACPSGVVVEMIRAAGDTGATMIRDVAKRICAEKDERTSNCITDDIQTYNNGGLIMVWG